MTTKRKPKKALVQALVALVIAAVVGIGAIGIGFVAFTMITQGAQSNIKAKEEEAEQLKAELQRVKRMAQGNQQDEKRRIQEVQAVKSIEPGMPITPDMVALVDIDSISSPDVIMRLSDVIGKTAASHIVAGESLSRAKLMAGDGLPMVKEGMRAITIKLDQVGGLNGALVPGVFVDVLATVDSGNEPVAKTIIQRAQVVSVGGGFVDSKQPSGQPGMKTGGIDSVTLAVTPREAEMLALANKKGTFHLALRNFKDTGSPKMGGVDVAQLVTGIDRQSITRQLPPPPRMPKLAPESPEINVNYTGQMTGLPMPAMPGPGGRKYTMEIFKGANSEEKTFEMSEH